MQYCNKERKSKEPKDYGRYTRQRVYSIADEVCKPVLRGILIEIYRCSYSRDYKCSKCEGQ